MNFLYYHSVHALLTMQFGADTMDLEQEEEEKSV